jgi:hypothetical protein
MWRQIGKDHKSDHDHHEGEEETSGSAGIAITTMMAELQDDEGRASGR